MEKLQGPHPEAFPPPRDCSDSQEKEAECEVIQEVFIWFHTKTGGQPALACPSLSSPYHSSLHQTLWLLSYSNDISFLGPGAKQQVCSVLRTLKLLLAKLRPGGQPFHRLTDRGLKTSTLNLLMELVMCSQLIPDK